MDKLRDAFAQSFSRTPTGQQSHDIPLLSFAEGRTRQVLTQTAKRVKRYWELESWDMAAIHLPTMVAKREYDACHDAVQQVDHAWDSALEALEAAMGPVEELLRAARDGAGQPSSADNALHALILMQLMIESDSPFDEEEWSNFAQDLRRSNQRVQLRLFRIRRNPLNEAVRSSFAEACRSLRTKLLTVQGVADHPVIAAYNAALDVVCLYTAPTRSRLHHPVAAGRAHRGAATCQGGVPRPLRRSERSRHPAAGPGSAGPRYSHRARDLRAVQGTGAAVADGRPGVPRSGPD